jgi:hypothetical protein
MNISFFGASVTAQGTGYVHEFKKLVEKDITVYQHGYGGMHISDAGIIYIDEVLKNKPNICFIDWFSTGYLVKKIDFLPYLDTIITKFSDNKVKLVFLFLPRNPFEELRDIMYKDAKEYLTECNITYIELDEIYNNLKKNIVIENDIMRDSVHTTDLGSKNYAEIIFNYFTTNINNLQVCSKLPVRNKYYDIKSIHFDSPITVTNEYEIQGSVSYIRFSINKCPNNGIILLNNKQYNTWDQWCYYSRKSLTGTLPTFENNLVIKITKKDFDKSLCKNKDFKWDKYEKLLTIHDIFYTIN